MWHTYPSTACLNISDFLTPLIKRMIKNADFAPLRL